MYIHIVMILLLTLLNSISPLNQLLPLHSSVLPSIQPRGPDPYSPLFLSLSLPIKPMQRGGEKRKCTVKVKAENMGPYEGNLKH